MIDLTAIMRDMLKEYGEEVTTEAVEVLNDLAPEIVREVASTSPENSGEYSKGWTAEKASNILGEKKVIIHNAEKPTLTHLLEFGHRGYPMKNGGRTPDVKAYPHIAKAQKWAANEAVSRLERKIQG